MPTFTVELSYNEESYALDTHTMQMPQRHTNMCTYTYTDISTHMYKYTHACTHACTQHTHTNTHTHVAT